MKLLVGIPSFRRPAMLARLLDSIARQEGLHGVDLEVFVADNDPERREAVALCRRLAPSFRFALSAGVAEIKGISGARNRILEQARATGADALAMIDDDEMASPQWLARLLATKAAYDADVVGGGLEYVFEAPVPADLARSGAFVPKRGVSGPRELINACGNVLLDCAALARLGWPEFDLAFGLSGGEDKEYFTRLGRGGLSFAWSAEAVAYETVPAERVRPRAVLRRAYAIGSSDYRIARLHGPAGASRRHLAKSAAVLAAAVPLAPVLLLPRWRLWLLRKHARALGRIASALGKGHAQYGAAVSH